MVIRTTDDTSAARTAVDPGTARMTRSRTSGAWRSLGTAESIVRIAAPGEAAIATTQA
jgi:hypothetical protein